MRVLIACGTWYGSTGEIALRMAKFLVEEEVEATVMDLNATRDRLSLEGFDGVMVGSGVRIGRWIGELREFLKRNREELEGKKLALFVSCFSAVSAPDYAREELLEKVMEETGVKADLYEAFGPLVDFSKGSRMGFPDRKIAQMVMGRMSGGTGV